MSNTQEFKMKKDKIMTIAMEDGLLIDFFYVDGEAWFGFCNGVRTHLNRVDESSINAVIGESLLLTYFSHGNTEKLETETKIKRIEYSEVCN